MTPEGLIKQSICQYLSLKKVYHRVIQIGGIRGRKNTGKGVTDIVGALPVSGRFLAIEVKTKTGVVTVEQQEFMDNINASGGLAFVARSVDDVIAQGI